MPPSPSPSPSRPAQSDPAQPDPALSLPPAPHIDATLIEGNLSSFEKQLNANALTYFMTGSGVSRIKTPFSAAIGRRVRIVEINVFEDDFGGVEGEVRYEVRVEEDMCNVYGTLHGGCAAYILDPCTMGAIFLLRNLKNLNMLGGISQNMNINWHHPAPLGTTLLITTRSVFAEGRTRLAWCEMRDKSTNSLILSGTHAFISAKPSAKL
ncbi:4HBT domain-containing protein [Favolaschia claudopus]|uniref:4HBT domain-containing protein n=1 Tax=Favolaschia claudopus TaxID=2862362 RepID=A0AAV9ZD85_9AGAR